MIKYILKTVISLFIVVPLFSQQLPQYSLYKLNDVIINPALISSKDYNQFSLMVRDQWSGFEGAPNTQSFSYYNVGHSEFGRGFNLFNDVSGPISILKGQISASKLIKTDFKHNLSIGASLSIHNYSFDNTQLVLENDGVIDPVINTSLIDKSNVMSADVGLSYFGKKFQIGASVLNILNTKINISETNDNSLVSHYYLNFDYKVMDNSNLKLTPGLLIKKIGASNIQFDANLMVDLNQSFFGGVTYRSSDAFITILGVNYQNYSFGYSYDFTFTEMNIPSYGSHAIVLNYRFKPKPKDKDKDGVFDFEDECPNTFGKIEFQGCPDSDNDNIINKEDDCPFEFGSVENSGCPDKDNDGIVDKYDECEETPGLKRFNGCPDTDNDGVKDDEDDCPNEKGTIKNNGCPEINLSDTISILKNEINRNNISLWAERIHFEYDKYNIDENSKIILEKIAEFLITDSDFTLHIIGHTDENGSKRYNKKLSINRANEVYRFLIKQGVDKTRLKAYGVGESQKISEKDNINRRVEFKIVN